MRIHSWQVMQGEGCGKYRLETAIHYQSFIRCSEPQLSLRIQVMLVIRYFMCYARLHRLSETGIGGFCLLLNMPYTKTTNLSLLHNTHKTRGDTIMYGIFFLQAVLLALHVSAQNSTFGFNSTSNSTIPNIPSTRYPLTTDGVCGTNGKMCLVNGTSPCCR